MVQKLDDMKETPSQTAGPYVHIGLTPNFCGIDGIFPKDLGRTIVGKATRGDRITITGQVLDGTGSPLRDAMLEIWQADADGRYPGTDGADPAFPGWGRAPTEGEKGEYRFDTIRPGPVPFRDGQLMNPHITVWVVARGINLGLHTRLYFPEDDPSRDPILSRIEHQNRVPTLIATATRAGTYRFDIRLQGENETIFFDV